MRIVLALGNPGSRYQTTRHNIGWLVADALAVRLRTEFKPAKGEYHEAQGRWRGKDVLIVKPTTYMNNSGIAAEQIARRYSLPPEEMLVVVDELQFPVGRVQIRPSGSSRGHNGLESLIHHLGSDRFPRLRCGVGNDFPAGGMADYVLGNFPQDQDALVVEMIAAARDAALTWIADGTAVAMTRHNKIAKASPEAPNTKVARSGTESTNPDKTDDSIS